MSPAESVTEPFSEHTPYLIRLIQFGVLAGMGGATKFISTSLKSTEKMSNRRFLVLLIANVFISGFSGLMGALMFSTVSPDITLQSVAAGIFGYIGAQGLDIIALTMQKKFFDKPQPISSIIPVPTSVDPAAK